MEGEWKRGTNDYLGVVWCAEVDADLVVWDAGGGVGGVGLLLAWGFGDFNEFCFDLSLGHCDSVLRLFLLVDCDVKIEGYCQSLKLYVRI